jgi:hypothetical protein
MRRAVAFLAVGPLAVVVAWLTAAQQSGLVNGRTLFFTAILFLFTMTVSAVVGLFDGYLEHALSPFPRACLTGVAGAIVAYVLAGELIFNLFGTVPSVLTVFAYGGATYAGVCSLLSNDWAATRAAADAPLQNRSARSIFRGVR